MSDKLGLGAFVDLWKKAGPALRAFSDQELKESDNCAELIALKELFDMAVLEHPALPESGLIEWQRLMRRLGEKTATRRNI